jgi:uncharacterized membrane protein YbhN (UPF0104 family)
VAERLPTAAQGLQQLRRVSWRLVVQAVLLFIALSILVSTVAGLDGQELTDELREATWWLVAAGFVVAQAPRITQTVSALGAAPRPLPFKPLYLLQLAQGYVGLAVPTSAARVAMNVRFFQKQGLSPGTALAIGGLDGLAGFLVEAALLVGLITLTPSSLQFDLDAPSLPEWRTILVSLAVLAVVLATVSVVFADRRRQVLEWARELLADGRSALSKLNSPRRLVLMLGGNVASILLFSAALGLFAAALGGIVPFADLVVVVISVSLLAGLLPVPGGIGVVESGLTLGLVAAGMPEGAAFAAVVLYRLSTTYLPPLWGFVAFRWLGRHDYL